MTPDRTESDDRVQPLIALLFDPMLARYVDVGEIPDTVDLIDVSGAHRVPDDAILAAADALIVARLDRSMIDKCVRLRLVQVPGAGIDGIPFDALPPSVAVAVTGNHGRSIAEYALMAMILMGRRLLRADDRLRQGHWEAPHIVSYSKAHVGDTLYGKTVLILGMGEIGCAVARLADAFGMRIVGVKQSTAPPRFPVPASTRLALIDQLDELLGTADHVVVALPLTDATRGLLGADRLRRLGPNTTLVNVARGPIVDAAALYEAVASHSIGGTAIDVWYQYPTSAEPTPPVDLPFAELDRVLMTPHIAGVTNETFRARAGDVMQNLARLSKGYPLMNLVWPTEAKEQM